MVKYYSPSGAFSYSSILYFSLVSITIFPLLGFIYAYCIWYIPFVYINFIITILFGFAIGYSIDKFVIGIGKVRNFWLSIIFGFIGSCIALYFHWLIWVDLVVNAGESYGTSRLGITVSNINYSQLLFLLSNPEILFSIISEITKTGTWSVGGSSSNSVNGTFLYIVWFIEFLIVLVVCLMTINKYRKPFCERENCWYKELKLKPFDYIVNVKKTVAKIEESNLEVLETISLQINPQRSHSIFILYTSRHNDCYLSIINKKAKRGKNEKMEFNTDHVVDYVAVNKEFKDRILGINK